MTPAVQVVAIVDPYDAGSMLAPAFREHGVVSVMVQSTPEIPSDKAEDFDPAPFSAVVGWRGELPEIVAALRHLAVDCVIAGSERGVNLADRLGEALGVRGNGTHLTQARRNKFRMIEEVGRRGLRVPRQFHSGSLQRILAWIRDTEDWPAVLKPLDAMGSDGVRLCASEADVAAAFDSIVGHTNVLGLLNEMVLAQQFLRGREYAVDTVSCDGRHRLVALWTYGKPTPGYASVGTMTTKELLQPQGVLADELFAYVTGVLDAVGIRHGAAHCEVIVDSAGPVLVEVGARLHGGPKAHQMCRAAVGTSQLDLLVQSYLYPARFLESIEQRRGLTGAAVMVLLREADLRGEIEDLPSAHEVVWNFRSGEPVPRIAGLATLIHQDRDVVETDLEIVTGGIYCDILDTRAEIETISPAWQDLLARSRCNRAFSGPSWYAAALDAYPELSPLVMVASRAGRVDGILPLGFDRKRQVAAFPTMLSDYNDMVAAAGDAAAARRLLNFARKMVGQPSQLLLNCVRPDSNCAQASGRQAQFSEKRYQCPLADVSSGYEAWLASRSRAFREDLRRKQRRAEQHGVRVARLDPSQDGHMKVAEIFLDLHYQRFRERSLFVRDPAARAFVERMLPQLFSERLVVLFGVWAEERLIGLNVCMLGADSLGYWNAGFQADAEHLSPGTLMLHAGLHEACAMGLAEFDLLRGQEAYKMKWCTGQREIGRLSWPN